MGDKIKIEQHSFSAFSWFTGWLFTIGFLELSVSKGIFALILWPYYLGIFVRTLFGS